MYEHCTRCSGGHGTPDTVCCLFCLFVFHGICMGGVVEGSRCEGWEQRNFQISLV